MEGSIAIRIKKLRNHYNLSLKEFSKKCGLSHVAIFQLEKGKTLKPHQNTLKKMASLFGANLDWLLYGNGEMLPNGTSSIYSIQNKSEIFWREEAYIEIRQKNILLEKEIERLWLLIDKFTKQDIQNFENIRVLGR